MEQGPRNYLTIDVEDYFQVAAFERVIRPESWEGFASRVEANTSKLLDLFDRHQVKATFFIVGWTARHYPDLVRAIADRGHEIGCHSYLHQKVYSLSPDEFRTDTRMAKEILEEISGQPVTGYRAPTYSITRKSLWALDILAELGFTWDSSIFPVIHDNYGIPDAPRFAYQLAKQQMTEYPLSTLELFGHRLPVAGGGYFRLFPYWFSRFALGRINRLEKQPFIFYLHPWEVDPEQPRINGAGLKSRFRHYLNLAKTEQRLDRLLTDFRFGPISGN